MKLQSIKEREAIIYKSFTCRSLMSAHRIYTLQTTEAYHKVVHTCVTNINIRATQLWQS